MAVESGTIQVVMPAMGDSVAEGTVLEWRKAVGDHVEADETIVEISTDKVDAEGPPPVGGTIVEISTDKVDMELPAPATGTIAEILAGDGETVTVGQVIGRITAAAPDTVAPAPREAADAVRAPDGAEGDQEDTHSVQVSSRSDGEGATASPVARRIAQQEGIDLS